MIENSQFNENLVWEKIHSLEKRYEELQNLINDPETTKNKDLYISAMQEYSHLREVFDGKEKLLALRKEIQDTKTLAKDENDPALKEMAEEELASLLSREEPLALQLRLLLLPKDPLDGKNIIMEIRAGTGGDEAALFVADMYRMYTRYAENQNWAIEILSTNAIDINGFKEVIFSISGKNVYANLRYESGVHRVQRIPVTETNGRIHTSAITIAVLPEAEETDVVINNEDLKIDIYRSSGAGGQHVNTTDSAVRITHLPSGIVVTCQDERSQIKNRAKALKVLRSRLYERQEKAKAEQLSHERKSQIGQGNRSERIRTYNFPQNRVTDHRINLTLYKLEQILGGALDELISALKIELQNS